MYAFEFHLEKLAFVLVQIYMLIEHILAVEFQTA